MIIREIPRTDIEAILARQGVGRLSCVKDNRPYIVPLNFAYDSGFLYAFTTMGKKIEWMRGNPNVCVAFDEVSATNEWKSVVVTGVYEELTEEPALMSARNTAYTLLQKKAEWWQPAYVETVIRDQKRPLTPIFFRISILESTGHEAVKTA